MTDDADTAHPGARTRPGGGVRTSGCVRIGEVSLADLDEAQLTALRRELVGCAVLVNVLLTV